MSAVVRHRRPSFAATGTGYRWTRQRDAVLDALRAGSTHLDASEVFDIARRSDPRLSLSTVYRTLAFLRDHGIVRELRLGEGHHHYEMCGPGGLAAAEARPSHHSHLVCRTCGAVFEFRSRLLERLRRELKREHGFTMDHPEMEISGLCRSCRPLQLPDSRSDQET